MELHMHWPRTRLHAPDWPAAIVSGIVAGAVMMVLTLLWSATDMGSHPWLTARKVAAIVMGQQVLVGADFSVSVIAAMAFTHYALGVAFSVVLATIVTTLRIDRAVGKVVAVGAAFGFALYLLNFYLMAEAFPWFMDDRGWANMLAHLTFGMVAAGVYWKLERPRAMRR